MDTFAVREYPFELVAVKSYAPIGLTAVGVPTRYHPDASDTFVKTIPGGRPDGIMLAIKVPAEKYVDA